MRQPLDRLEYKRWSRNFDFKFNSKKIGTWILELYGGYRRGGYIAVWEKRKNRYYKFDTIHFMRYNNALDRYKSVNTVSDLIYLLKEG